uniref:peptidylprolyl isomerase n=1 Tax=Neogobius melanostomus TaxID=47308 RepID=A0A8C6SVU7_9GOBI
MKVNEQPQCYFDVELNREPVGRIVFQLFSDVCPKTSTNFLCLCTGEKGTGKTTGKKLCYKGSTFHRVVKNFMIQGGDFTDGTGRGGESIYGGYFEDENFTLKHDKAYLLSMANRGKDTNGSQFFITTNTAPHLDGVHVVFGSVISGYEVIKRIEGLKTDSASRPYADVRVVDCGQLITKSANDVLENIRKRKSKSAGPVESQDSPHTSPPGPEGEAENKQKNEQKRKKNLKTRLAKKRRKNTKKNPAEPQTTKGNSGEDKEQCAKREKPVVRPEEIPPVPENRFLLRRDMPLQENKTQIVEMGESTVTSEQKPSVSKSGRKIKGRGTMRYHTPTRSKSRSVSVEEQGSSETPPHWKEEMKRTKVYQPPSTERWSKGDKLTEHTASRWDDRSNSAWSQSPEPLSNRYSDHMSPQHQQKKEKKKKKRKRKTRKRKSKKITKKPVQALSDGERSPSPERKQKRKRSLSRSRSQSASSLRHSSNKRRRRSSRSPRYSRSYSRSHQSSRSRSRRRSRSYSRSRSRSRSRTRSRSSSRSRKTRSSNSEKRSEGPRLPPVTEPEAAPVIPLSESPPPSRWKPGQKPWKPSYVHIEETKAKVSRSTLSSNRETTDGKEEDIGSSARRVSLETKGSILQQLENIEHKSIATATAEGKLAEGVKPLGAGIALKWKPLKGMAALQNVSVAPVTVKTAQSQKNQVLSKQGVKMEIKSKSLVRPGSLFDEVRKTARLNQRPRNQESSSEEKSPLIIKNRSTSRTRSLKKSRKSRSASSHRSRSRGWSHSSRSRSRSHSSSYSSRSEKVSPNLTGVKHM